MSNNNEILAKLDALTKEVEEKKKKAISNAKTNAIIYGVLVIFVFGYTSFIFAKIKELATPETIAMTVKEQIKKSLPKINDAIIEQTKKNAPILADKAVSAVHEVIPKIEDIIKEVIDEHAKVLVTELKTELFPKFSKIIKENAKDINDSAAALTDETTAQELAKIIVKELDQQIDYNNIIGDEFYEKFNNLTKELDSIASKSPAELTLKEATERRIIVQWIYLIKKGESVQSVATALVQRCSFIWEDLIGNVIPSKDSQVPVFEE